MTFIRTKTIKGKEYAYLIKNKWLKSKGRPKQRVAGYIGKVIRPQPKEGTEEISFFDHKSIMDTDEYMSETSREQILKDLMEYEISRYDVDVSLDFDAATLKQGSRNVAMRINEGYLCGHTIKELKTLAPEGEEEEVGLALARGFVNAGIAIPRDIFVGYFSKIFK